MKLQIGKTRKGLTLVELIAVCAITVVIVGAACAALYAGSGGAAKGVAELAGHGDANLLETWLLNNLPNASGLSVGEKQSGDEVFHLFYESGGQLVAEKGGTVQMRFDGIESLTISSSDAGANQKLHYDILAKSGQSPFQISGGIVLNNIHTVSINETLSPDAASAYVNITK